jgi:hypothetical protein
VSIDAIADGERAFVLSSVNFPDKKMSGKTAKDSVKDVHLWINPFATQYQLAVTGFLPTFIEVKPFVGSLIVPGRDLTPVPTVLLRPYFEGSRALGGGGVLELYKKTTSGFRELDDKGKGDNAWFIGPRRKQPAELQSSWQIELTALGMDPRLSASLLQRWLAPKAIATEELLAVDDTLCALIANVDGTAYVAGAVVQITRDPYIDLSLRDFKHESTNTDRRATGAEQCAELDSSPG